ncbi:MAG: hypothetical protein ACREQF_10440 [Candidatus Binataceae bacterium]
MLKSGQIEYVFAAVQAADVSGVERRIGQLVDAGGEAQWMVFDIMGNVVVFARGLDVMEKWHPFSQNDLIALLHRRTDNDARVIFGTEHLSYGNLGSDSRMSYGVLFTRTPEIMAALMKVQPGAAERFSDG